MLFTAVHLPAAAGTLSRRGDRSACCVNRGGRSPAAWRADVHEPNRRTMTALLGQPRPRASTRTRGGKVGVELGLGGLDLPVISTPRRVSCSASGSPRLSVPSPATESILFMSQTAGQRSPRGMAGGRARPLVRARGSPAAGGVCARRVQRCPLGPPVLLLRGSQSSGPQPVGPRAEMADHCADTR